MVREFHGFRNIYINPDGYVGKKLGTWAVLEEVEKDGEILYHCRCVCGTERLVKYKDMAKLPGRSCGCIREQRKKEAVVLYLPLRLRYRALRPPFCTYLRKKPQLRLWQGKPKMTGRASRTYFFDSII